MKDVEKVKVAVTLTARRKTKKHIKKWLNYIKSVLRNSRLNNVPIIWLLFREISCIAGILFLRESLKNQCPGDVSIEKCVVCVPQNPKNRLWLQNNVGCKPEKYWCAIQHAFRGAGDTWREACAFSFKACKCGQSNIEVKYVLHTPIDLDYGNPRSPEDVQNHIGKILELISPSQSCKLPDLVIGDYKTPNVIKKEIEKAVIEQLKHYIPNHIAIREQIERPRSEFFLISKDLFFLPEVQNVWTNYPRDPMPMILDVADRKGYLVQKVDLGMFDPIDSEYTAKNINDQIFRTAFQISMYWAQDKGYQANDVLRKIDKCKLLKGMKIAHKKSKQIFEIGFSRIRLQDLEG